MSGWGIAETAPVIEKIKAESADYLRGLNSCGDITWSVYDKAFDFYMELISRAYEQGKKDAQPEHNPDDERKIADLHKIVNYLLSQPERKTGKWLDGDEMPNYPRIPYLPWMKYCSACGNLTTERDDSLYDFCPFCGADMRGVEDVDNE